MAQALAWADEQLRNQPSLLGLEKLLGLRKAAAGGQALQVLEGAGGVGDEFAGRVVHRAFAEGQRDGAAEAEAARSHQLFYRLAG